MRLLSIAFLAALALLCLGLSLPRAGTAADDAPPAAAPAVPAPTAPPASPPADQQAAQEALQKGVGSFLDNMKQALGGPADRPPKVFVGEPKQWRTLWAYDPSNDEVEPDDLGHYEPGGDDEFLACRANGLNLLRLDGSFRALGIKNAYKPDWGDTSWDFNGDGIDDLIDSRFDKLDAEEDKTDLNGKADHMLAVGIDGKPLGKVPGVPIGPRILKGDLDGDGKPDLFMVAQGHYGDFSHGYVGIGLGGKVILHVDNRWDSDKIIEGDIDGDGKKEILEAGALGATIRYTGIGKSEREIEAPDRESIYPEFCTDLNGDGTDEIVDGYGLVFDPRTRKTWRLASPPGFLEWMIQGGFGGGVQVFHENGKTELAALLIRMPPPKEGSPIGSDTLAIWDATGKLVYAERFPGQAAGLLVGKFQGKDRLLLMGGRHVFIWP